MEVNYDEDQTSEDLSLAEIFMDDDDLVRLFFKVLGDVTADVNGVSK